MVNADWNADLYADSGSNTASSSFENLDKKTFG